MINHGIQHGTLEPPAIEMTDNYVFIAKNITPYSEEIEGHTINGF